MNPRTLIFVALTTLAMPIAGASGILAPPRSVEASDGAYDGAVLVTWTSVRGADSYRVFRSDSGDWKTARTIGVTSDTAFIDPATSSDPRQVYHYWIVAESGHAVSAYSESDAGRIRPGTSVARHRLRQNFRRLRSRLPE